MVHIRRAFIFSVAVFIANWGVITEVILDGEAYEDMRSTEEYIELSKEYGYPPPRSVKGVKITVGPIHWVIASLLEFSGTILAFVLSMAAFSLHGKIQSMHYGSRFFVDKPNASFLPFEIFIVLLVAIINCLLFCGD